MVTGTSDSPFADKLCIKIRVETWAESRRPFALEQAGRMTSAKHRKKFLRSDANSISIVAFRFHGVVIYAEKLTTSTPQATLVVNQVENE
jgi:hypothetical protein